jgi:apolipoprotein N-acyltransferase
MHMLGLLPVFWISQFLSFPPWSLFWLSPLYLSLFFFFAEQAPSPRLAFDRLFLMVLPFWAYQVRWITSLPVFPEQQTPLVSAVLFLVLWEGLFMGGVAALYNRLHTDSPLKNTFLAAALWTGMEWLRTTGDLRFLWAPLWSTTLNHLKLAALLPMIGPFGWTFLWTLGSVALGYGLRTRERSLWIVALLVGGTFAGSTRWTHPPVPDGMLRVLVVQPAYLPARFGSSDPSERDSLLNRYRELLRDIPDGVDLMLFPETSFPGLYGREKEVQRFLDSLQAEHPIPLLLGMSTTPDTGRALRIVHNSVILRRPDTPIAGIYHKRILVPFGEMFPMEDRIPALGILDLRHQPLLPGHTPPRIRIADTLTAGVAICYEVLFPDAIRRAVLHGSRLIVNFSNDAWFGEGLGPRELLDLSRFRAMETGKALLRVGREGGSALILPDGWVAASLPRGQAHAAVWTVPLYRAETPYTRCGDAPVLGLVGAALLFFLLLMRKNVERPPSDTV